MMKKLLSVTILSLLAICAQCFAETLLQVEKGLGSRDRGEKAKAVSELCSLIDDEKLERDARVAAVELAAKTKVIESTDVLIRNIDGIWRRDKSIMSFERLHPCVEALMSLGDASVPKIVEAIKKEDDEQRLLLLSYSLLRIMKQEPALAHLEKLLVEDAIAPAVKKRLQASKAEVAKWSDYPWDIREIKK